MTLSNTLVRPVAAFLSCLLLAACGGGGGAGNGNGNQTNGSFALLSSYPADGATGVLSRVEIEVALDAEIDPAEYWEQFVEVEANGTGVSVQDAHVESGNRLRFKPRIALPDNATVIVRVLPGIQDVEGRESDETSSFSFRVETAIVGAEAPHEADADARSVRALALNASGDGMSVMHTGTSSFRTRRILDGVPQASHALVPTGHAPNIAARNVDVASNGDVQVAYTKSNGTRRELGIRRFDASASVWLDEMSLAPFNSSDVQEIAAETDSNGGMVAWIERETGGDDRGALFVGFPTATGTMDDPIVIRLLDKRRRAVRLSRSGVRATVAWVEYTPNGQTLVAMRHHATGGFELAEEIAIDRRAIYISALETAANGRRYLLYTDVDPSDLSTGTFHLAVAEPGLPFGAPQPLHSAPASYNNGPPRLAVLGDGSAVVAYALDNELEPGMWARRYVPGQGLSAAIEMGRMPGEQDAPVVRDYDMEAAADGTAHVGIEITTPSGGHEVRAVALPRQGERGTIRRLGAAALRPSSATVEVAVGPQGGVVVAWTHAAATSPADWDVRLRRIEAGGDLGPLRAYATNHANAVRYLRAAHAPSGNGVLIYDRLRTGGSDVYQIDLR